jgi:hypothetical protein
MMDFIQMAPKNIPDESPKSKYERAPVSELLLDPINPRLGEYGIKQGATQADLLKVLWEKMAVEELAMSIAYNGYFEHEPLLVETNAKGGLVVIEGNRRLAAVKLLLDEGARKSLKATDLPKIDQTRRTEISELPIIRTTRKDVWRYLGFKHVNGPSTWGSYAKAQYVALVHNSYGVPLEEIAKQIGDYNCTVLRMYRGLMIIEQAERSKVFDRNNIEKNDFYFNYIYTGIDYPGIRKYLGIDGDKLASKNPVPPKKIKNLGMLCEWLYGNETLSKPSLIKSQNPDLKKLDEILLSEKGVQALSDGLPLAVAHDISLGDERIFRQALQQAKQALQKAHATLTTGYSVSDGESLAMATDIEHLASDLVSGIMEKRKKRKQKARSSD